MTSQDALLIQSSSLDGVVSSSLYLFVQSKISSEASRGGSFVLDPLLGYDQYCPLDMQNAIWSKFRQDGFVLSNVNDSLISGSFHTASTIKITWNQ